MPPTDTVNQDGPRIRALRQARGWSLAEAARKVGLHPKSLGHIERGTRRPSAEKFARIARALDVPPGQITRTGAGQ